MLDERLQVKLAGEIEKTIRIKREKELMVICQRAIKEEIEKTSAIGTTTHEVEACLEFIKEYIHKEIFLEG